MFSRVEIWVDPARDVSLKQVLTEPSGDVHTDTFYGIKTNTNIPAGTFVLNAKALGAQVIQH
jgi:outer membrane lipoprotein-sorting protein